MPVLPADLLRVSCRMLFDVAGMEGEDADSVAFGLVDANLAGHDSHGVMLAPRYIKELREGLLQPTVKLEIERETPCMARVNAHDSQGHPAARRVTELAIAKAKRQGVATVACHHIGHVGRLGGYVEQAAAADCVAIAAINNHGLGTWMAPFGGTDRRLSPNPLAIGAPTDGSVPLVLDMSTSVVAAGKCLVAQSKGEAIPPDWLLDGAGRPTTDPAALFGPPAGALLPLGGLTAGHKGYSLCYMLDVLAGALSTAGCSAAQAPAHRNALFLTVLSIEHFTTRAEFVAEVAALTKWVKASPRAEGCEEILFPGEWEARNRKRRGAEGIPIPDPVWRSLSDTAVSLGIPPLRYG